MLRGEAEARAEARRRWAAGGLAAVTAAGLAGLLAGGGVGLWSAAIAFALWPSALVLLATAGQRRWRWIALAAGLLAASLGASLGGLLLLRGRLAESPWPGGVPLALWLLFAGLWLVPLVVTGLGHGLAFDGADADDGTPGPDAPGDGGGGA